MRLIWQSRASRRDSSHEHPSATAGSQGATDIDRQIKIFEHLTLPAMQDECARAIALDEIPDVRSENQRAVRPFLKQFLMTPLLKTVIAGGDDLVDQIAIEIDGERQGKVEPPRHSCRIGLNWFRQEFSELGDIIDEIAQLLKWLAIDAGEEGLGALRVFHRQLCGG
jgi:hypothetical protein